MKFFLILFALCISLQAHPQNLTIYRSEKSVEETVKSLIRIIKQKNLEYFETIAHDRIAWKNGVYIPPTREILFEDSELTAELLSCRQTTALDLPMKILVWEENQDVYIGYFDPRIMKKRFLLHNCEPLIDRMSNLKIRIVNELLKEDSQ